jgi:type IV pilus assembly protein PilV
MKRQSIQDARRQYGFTMFEILVTLGIVTIWLLATAGVQTSSAKLNKAAQYRTQAVIAATDIGERIEANKTGAATGAYACGGSGTACIPPAGTSPSCTAASGRAACDLWEWATRVVAVLPASASTTSIVWNSGATPPAYTITIGWSDRGDSRTTGTTEASTYQAVKTIN